MNHSSVVFIVVWMPVVRIQLLTLANWLSQFQYIANSIPKNKMNRLCNYVHIVFDFKSIGFRVEHDVSKPEQAKTGFKAGGNSDDKDD